MKVLAFIIGVLSAALPAGAQTVSPRAAALLDVLIANDCGMSKAEAAAKLPDLGFSRREYRGLIGELNAAGMVTLSRGAAQVVEVLCPAAPVAVQPLTSFQEQYISIIRHNGCAVYGDEAETLFPAYGMEADLAYELEAGLVESGIAYVYGEALRIKPEYCIADEAFAATPARALTAEERHLVEVLESGYCTLVQSEIEISFPQDGMEPEVAQAAVKSLLASGLVMAVEGGDRIWAAPAICQPWSEREN